MNNYLSNSLLFKNLSEQEMEIISNIITIRSFPANSFIFHQDDPAEMMYVIISGKIAIEINKGQKKERLLELSTNQLVGEIAFIDQSPRTAAAYCTEETVAGCITDEIWKMIRDKHPLIYQQILENMLVYLAQMIRKTDEQLFGNFH